MSYLLAFLPIFVILVLMLGFRWGGQRAGPAGWLTAMAVGALFFGLTPQVWWISQLKGLLLTLFVLGVIWPALLLYNLVNNVGGIDAIAGGLEGMVGNRGLLLVLMAWAFSGALEGLAGFGIPVAVVAPMLVALGVDPLRAVAAVAVGHAWAVTFGDVGVVFQTLIGVSQMSALELAPAAALMLGAACLLCGLGAAFILKQGRCWPWVVGLAILMSAVQFSLAVTALSPLAGLLASLSGLLAGVLLGRARKVQFMAGFNRHALLDALFAYGGLTVLLAVLALPTPLHVWLMTIVWQPVFPEAITSSSFITPQGAGTAFQWLLHPGAAILLTAAFSTVLFYRRGHLAAQGIRAALKATWRSAAPVSLGIASTVGVAALMDHCGMTLLLAQGLAGLMGSAYPLVSPWVGMLGAFATGSNNNSNVLFASLQKNAAQILGLDTRWLVGAQTAGGSMGSMIAPAKLIVGCSTVGMQGRDGAVLRKTLPYGLVIGLVLGVIVWLVSGGASSPW